MHSQFLTAQRRQNRNRDQASRPPIQVRSGPEGTPGRLRDEALEVSIEPGGASLRLLNVLAPEHLFADLHSNVEALFRHDSSSGNELDVSRPKSLTAFSFRIK